MRNIIHHTLAPFHATTQRSHVRLRPSFVNENKPFYVKSFLQLLPLFPLDSDILTMPLCRMESLVFHVIFKRCKKVYSVTTVTSSLLGNMA